MRTFPAVWGLNPRTNPGEYRPIFSNPRVRPKASDAEATGSSDACCARAVLRATEPNNSATVVNRALVTRPDSTRGADIKGPSRGINVYRQLKSRSPA